MWGGDFAHQNSLTFDTLDAIISYLESKYSHKYQFEWSTMSRYFESVYAEAESKKIQWSRKNNDFWAYNF